MQPPIAEVPISNVIIACYATDPMQYRCLRYREAAYIVFGSRLALGTIQDDKLHWGMK